MERYNRLSTPPKNALRTIEVGKLKGKSDINPQWKIEALTEVFGLCGVGWTVEIVEEKTFPLDNGEILLYLKVALKVKDGDAWSAPIYGYGGDFIVQKNKNGLVPNDEAYKMCFTDALGNAAKCVGVAADVFRGVYDTKYQKNEVGQMNAGKDDEKRRLLNKLMAKAKEAGCLEKMPTIIKAKFGKESSKDLSVGEVQYLFNNFDALMK